MPKTDRPAPAHDRVVRIQFGPAAFPGLLMAAGGLDEGDAPRVFRLGDFARKGFAGLLKAGKIPEIWKVAALLRLDGLHGAVVAVQKNAPAVRFFLQSQPAAIPAQPRELLDEIRFAQAFERGEPGDFRIRQTHLPRPTAAGRAALTLIENRHGRIRFPIRPV